MKSLVVSVLGWVLVPLLAFAQGKVELNTITGVEVNGSTVEIIGSKKPNFTTFTMTDPPRLVIDISEAVLSGVPDALRPTGGIVTGLRSANYGSDSSAIARVLIGYDREVETDIQVNGNVLVVKVLDGSGPLVAQAGNGPSAAETQAGTAQATQANGAAGQATAAKQAEEERRARELAAAEEKKRQEDMARADVEAKKQAEAEEKKRKAAEAEQQRLAAIEEKKRKQEEAHAEAETKKQEEAAERKRKAEEAEQQRLATLEEKKRKQEEARASAATRVASAEVPRRGEPEGTLPASVSERRKTLEIVGFQQQAGGARVYVRTNEPVSYKVSEGRNEIVLMLENTQIGKGNNTRGLDTSFFDTAVARVDPAVGPDRSVRVSIKLKESVPVQTRQEGNTISLEFPRPGR
jgi:hypothetical protein